MKERVKRSGWRARDRQQHMGMEIAQRSKGNWMVEELYSDQTMGMEIMAMMMTRREHVGFENNDGGMFWQAMEGLLEKERHQKERGTKSTKESEKESEKEERNNKNL